MTAEDDALTHQVQVRTLAVVVGMVMFFALPITLGEWLGYEWRWTIPTLVSTHSIIGLAFGLVWPEGSWLGPIHVCFLASASAFRPFPGRRIHYPEKHSAGYSGTPEYVTDVGCCVFWRSARSFHEETAIH